MGRRRRWAFLMIPGVVAKSKPDIVLTVIDDLGYGDVSYHDDAMWSPEMARMAKDGVVLERFYTGCTCTPSRTMAMTGRYTIRSGMQDSVIHSTEPRGVPLDEVFLPEKLQRAGYTTFGVGKWHLGMHRRQFLPESRGFQRWFGIYTGGGSHTEHISVSQPFRIRDSEGSIVWQGRNLYEDSVPVNESLVQGLHTTHLYSEKAMAYLTSQGEAPKFLYLGYQAVHDPIQVGDYDRYVAGTPCADISGTRQFLCGMVAEVDDGLKSLRLASGENWDSTVVFVISDNGGVLAHGSSNGALRGEKGTYYEGGIRVPAIVAGGLVEGYHSRTLEKKFHLVDLHATILDVAQYDTAELLDGVSFWSDITSTTKPPSKKDEDKVILINQNSALFGGSGALLMGDYKLVVNPDPREVAIYAKVREKLASSRGSSVDSILAAAHRQVLGETHYALYDVVKNPSELDDDASCDVCRNLYDVPAFAAVRAKLERKWAEFQTIAVPSSFAWEDDGPLADPALFDGIWAPWRDDDDRPRASYAPISEETSKGSSSTNLQVVDETLGGATRTLVLITLVSFCVGALTARASVRRSSFTRLP